MENTTQLDRGSASIFVELKDGIITVTHGTDQVVLFSESVLAGTWDAMWDAITMGAVELPNVITTCKV